MRRPSSRDDLVALRCRAVALLVLTQACAEPGTSGGPASLPLVTLGEPTLEIGAIEGADEYLFGAIESVVRLEDGSVAVSDAGAFRVSVYDEEGTFLRSWGQRGDGPGEFQNLSRIYPLRGDSLMVAHGFAPRVSVFDATGELGRDFQASSLTGDTVFALDSWLYGRFWVDGALTDDERERVRRVLDGLPRPRAAPGYRSVRVHADGRLWVREPAGDGETLWTRLDPSGTPEAVLRVPARFRPTWISGDDVLGVWRDETDVHFVRGYTMAGTGESVGVPAWLRGEESTVAVEAVPDDDELMSEIRGAIKNMASYQEIHYAGHYSYTTDVSALEGFEPPETLSIDFTVGNTRGWAAVFAHAGVDRLCGLAYGFHLPPGWTPGMVVCGPAHGER